MTIKFDFDDPYDLEKISTKIFRPMLTWGIWKPGAWGWTYNIYLDHNSNRYVVFDFPRKGQTLFFDELPSEDTELEIPNVSIMHHSDDTTKRPIKIKIQH